MFMRRNASGVAIYYLLVGEGCCACLGGSNVVVYTAGSAMGPYVRQGDVGSNRTPFDKASPYNYVTRAQGTKVVPVGDQWLWMGNQWVTATAPGRPRNRDLLAWYLLEFNDAGVIQQLVYTTETILR